jgi:NAD(P)-dependent dehydrogenase (short-subunit alcohol dehydrogenase family)
MNPSAQPLKDKVAVVVGATRGAGRGIAVELGAAGATVYCTGRSIRGQPSTYKRPETIEETAELVSAEGGVGIPVQVDYLSPEQVKKLAAKISLEFGHLDVLVNDIGGEGDTTWNKPIWEQPLEGGLFSLRSGVDTHIISSHFLLPLLIKNKGGLMVEIGDGTASYNETTYRPTFFYYLAKTMVNRIAWALAKELEPYDCTALSLAPGWLRSEDMLDNFGVSQENWRDVIKKAPDFELSESPRYVGRAVASLVADKNVSRFNGYSLSSGELAKVYGFTDLDGSQPDFWRYLVEVKEAGKEGNLLDYK